MNRLIFAVRAFWVLLMDLPHAYGDVKYNSIVGSVDEVEDIMKVLVSDYNNTIEQENVLDEAKKII